VTGFTELTKFTIRPPQPGDMGKVVALHGALYAAEYGWDTRFEALVARIVADFVDHLDPTCERAWIVELAGEVVGSAFIVKKSKHVAKLRLVIVHPKARGQQLGAQLTAQCEAFARAVGYRKIVLWTNSVLIAARLIYQRAGYRLTASEPHHSFGVDLVGETWEKSLLDLTSRAAPKNADMNNSVQKVAREIN
jgi:GNAT superfamily N-acetyltransferase